MTSSYRDNIEDYYQIAEDAEPAGTITVDNELIDFLTGQELVDPDTQEQLTGETQETVALASNNNCKPVVVTNDETPVTVDQVNRSFSEVEVSLLGVPRSETALNLLDTVNIYGVNSKEWAASSFYTYFSDPTDWTNQPDSSGINHGRYTRHVSTESAIQAYSYPPPKSFTYLFDDNSGRFPGGYTNGVMTAGWTSKRAFRYQPGRVTGFTMGVRMSTLTDTEGEVIQWGCKNDYGDGYYFQLERGVDLYIVRTSPGLPTLKIPRDEWSGDGIFANEGLTGWNLDLSRVTMFKIEFSWYGAVGAKFMVYVPDGNGEARWVELHYIVVENQNTKPSLRSAYMRMFTSTRSVAGAEAPTFINLYGSSVYIDGGDKGTVILGAANLESPKNIDTNSRSLLGLNIKGQINGVDNQRAVYPISLSAYASVDARFDLILRSNSCGGVQYGYGTGSSISRGSSATYSGSVNQGTKFVLASGQFPDISAEVSGTTNYLTGRRVKVNGNGVYMTHVTAINSGLTEITVDRVLPSSLAEVSLSRLNEYAVGDAVIPSGIEQGTIYRKDSAGYWRLGLWPQASGTYDDTKDVAWFASSYPRLAFNSTTGQPNGEVRYPIALGCNEATNFTVTTGTTSTVTAGGNSVTVSGSPWPIAVVAELMDNGQISNGVISQGENITTVGSGATTAITTWTTSTGITLSTTAAGGSGYIAHKFEDAISDPLSAVLVDRQGTYVMPIDDRVATVFIGSGETKTYDLSHVFGPDKMFITGPPDSGFNTGALFVMATSRAGSGIASAMLNWEEQ